MQESPESLHSDLHQEMFKCWYCNLSFQSFLLLLEHCKTHKTLNGKPGVVKETCKESKIDSSFECVKCNVKFETFQKLLNHTTNQPINTDETNQHKYLDCASTALCSRNYSCRICKRKFKYESSMNLHEKGHYVVEYSCVYCHKIFEDEFGLKEHERHYCSTNYSCMFCHKVFKCEFLLKEHEKRHRIHYPFGCNECNKTFGSKFRLNNHIEIYHKRYRIMQCGICASSFNMKPSLHTISIAKFEEKNRLKCNICRKHFVNTLDFTNHLDCHRNYPNYKCRVCKKKFFQRRYLIKHNCSRFINARLSYRCNNCDQYFSERNSLMRHLCVNMCKFCDKIFPDCNTLIVHERSHTGEAPYICSVCRDCFASLNLLNYHRKSKHK